MAIMAFGHDRLQTEDVKKGAPPESVFDSHVFTFVLFASLKGKKLMRIRSCLPFFLLRCKARCLVTHSY